jgi:hypothetical protein
MTIRHSIRKLHPFVCLLLLAVPAAIAEPLKLVGLVGLEKGHWLVGFTILIGGYLLSLFLVNRIFRIVQPRLLALPWFASVRAKLLEYRSSFLSRGREILRKVMIGVESKGANKASRYAGVFLAVILIFDGTPAFSTDNNCRRLDVLLAKEYAGLKLGVDQQALKRRLVTWHESICRERQAFRLWRRACECGSPNNSLRHRTAAL